MSRHSFVPTGQSECYPLTLVDGGLINGHRVLLDDTDVTGSKGGHAYESFGIDPEQITLVVIRPDGYVGTIVPSTAVADLENYFASFLIPQCLDF